jgi:RHS repeat-associated protein
VYQDNGSTLIFDTNAGDLWSYNYDIFNRLIKVSKSTAGTAGLATVAEYTYDAENLRIKKSSAKSGDTWFVYGLNGEVLFEETAKDTARYVYVNGRHFAMVETDKATNTSSTYFYSLDHLGSTEMVTDSAGKVVWQNEATPFGEWSGEIGVMHLKGKFTGKDFDDEIGLYYYNARWMDPETGRFISEDPAKDGRNWYVYCKSNPMRFIDANGKEATPAPHANDPQPAQVGNVQEFQDKAMIAKLAQAAFYKSTIKDPNTRAQVIEMLTKKFGTLDTNADPGSGFSNDGPSLSVDWNFSYSAFNFDFLEAKSVTQTRYEAGMDTGPLGRFMFFANPNVSFNADSNPAPAALGYTPSALESIQNLPSNANIENILGLQAGSMQNRPVTSYGNFNKTADSNFNIGFTTGKTTLAEGWDTIFNNILFPIAGGIAKGIPAAKAAASVFVNTATKGGLPYWSVMAPMPNPTFETVSGEMAVPTTPQFLNMGQLMYYYPDFAVDLAMGLAVGKEMKK